MQDLRKKELKQEVLIRDCKHGGGNVTAMDYIPCETYGRQVHDMPHSVEEKERHGFWKTRQPQAMAI